MILPPVHAALVGEDVIILDLATDRYRRLGTSDAAVFRRYVFQDVLEPASSGRLLASGLSKGARERLLELRRLAQPDLDFEMVAAVPTNFSLARVAIELWRSHRGIRRHGLHEMLSRIATYSLPMVDDVTTAASLAEGFSRALRSLPLRPRCLRDSLAFHRIAATKGLRTTLVVGVTDRPFAAHCWVQAGNVVLTDRIAQIAPFAPILAI